VDLKTVCRNCEEQTAEEKRELELEKKQYIYMTYAYIYTRFIATFAPNICPISRL
jgi:hypothetical protein